MYILYKCVRVCVCVCVCISACISACVCVVCISIRVCNVSCTSSDNHFSLVMSILTVVQTVLWPVQTNSVTSSRVQVLTVQQTQLANILSHIITVYMFFKFTPTIISLFPNWFTGMNVTCPQLELLPEGSECLL